MQLEQRHNSDVILNSVDVQQIEVISSVLSELPGQIRREEGLFLVRPVSVAFNSLLNAAHLSANAKMLATIYSGRIGAEAAALVSPTMTLTLGGAVGCLLGVGLQMGNITGNNSDLIIRKKAGDVAKVSWLLSVVFGTAVTGVMISLKWFLPIFYGESGHVAGDFFLGYSINGIPYLLLVGPNPQIAFQAGDWQMPVLFSVLNYIPAGFLSYYLGVTCGYGAFGVGLGGSIVGVVNASVMQLCFLRKPYKDFHLYNCHIEDLSGILKKLWGLGWPLSLQRLTEWGNLALLTVAIKKSGDEVDLAAADATLQYVILIAMSMQGLAHGVAMIISKNRKEMKQAYLYQDLERFTMLNKRNIQVLIKSNIFAITVSTILASIFYWQRAKLSDFFLMRPQESEVTVDLSRNLLWVAMLGAIPDMGRITCLGALRSWRDIIKPTLMSFLLSSLISIAFGYAMHNRIDNFAMAQFIARGIMMVAAFSVVANQCRVQIDNDHDNPDESFGVSADSQDNNVRSTSSSCLTTCFSFFKSTSAREMVTKSLASGTVSNPYVNLGK